MRLSEVLAENESFRFDSEYFKKEYLNTQNILSVLNSQYLHSYYVFNGRYKQPIYDIKSDLKVLNSRYLKDDYLDYENAKTGYGKLVPKNAVMINSTGIGTLGRVNINYLINDISIDNHINIIITKNINPYYLTYFLKSYYGQSQINRRYSGSSGQIEIYPRDFHFFKIPIFSEHLQSSIELLVVSAHENLQKSEVLYKEAEQLLLEELDLLDFKSSTENIAIKKLSESFGTTGRLDAEYYQPKYEEIENVISKYRLGYNAIGSVFKLSKQNFKVDKDKLYEYVEIGSINVSSGEIVPELITGAELPSNAKRKLKVGQVIVSKVRTYRSGIAIIDKDNYVGSTAFSILEEKPNGKVNKETLFSFLRSNLFLEWSLKPNTGTSYPVILDEDILNFNIPLIDTNIQNIIASKIQ